MTTETLERANESASEDDIEVPNWLNAEFLETHLKNYYGNDEIKVIGFEVHSATAKGENFASSIYRTIVEFCNNSTITKQVFFPMSDFLHFLSNLNLLWFLLISSKSFEKNIFFFWFIFSSFSAIDESFSYLSF